MERFVYYTPKSFFHVGRAHRDKLVEAHGRLDPLIKDLIRDEMREPRLAISPGERAAWPGAAYGSAGCSDLRWCRCSPSRLHHGGAPLETPVPALRDAALGDARVARRGRQPLHALQSHPDRPVLRRCRLDHRGGGRRLAAAARRSFLYSSVTPPVLITLAHLSVSLGDEFAEVRRAAGDQHAAELRQARLDLGIGERRR